MSYPIALRLENRRCVVIGGGKVAARKVAGLLAAGAKVYVISREVNPELEILAGRISLQIADYETGLLEKIAPFLVFAATDNPKINQQVARDAEKIGALVNVADAPADSDFVNMATFQQGPITVAVSTDGESPALARHLKKELGAVIGSEYATLAGWMGEIRPQIQNEIAQQNDRAAFWQTILESSVLNLLQVCEVEQARLIFEQLVAESKVPQV